MKSIPHVTINIDHTKDKVCLSFIAFLDAMIGLSERMHGIIIHIYRASSFTSSTFFACFPGMTTMLTDLEFAMEHILVTVHSEKELGPVLTSTMFMSICQYSRAVLIRAHKVSLENTTICDGNVKLSVQE